MHLIIFWFFINSSSIINQSINMIKHNPATLKKLIYSWDMKMILFYIDMFISEAFMIFRYWMKGEDYYNFYDYIMLVFHSRDTPQQLWWLLRREWGNLMKKVFISCRRMYVCIKAGNKNII